MNLTSLERKVKICIWNGESIKEIAKRLNKKEKIIEQALTRVKKKKKLINQIIVAYKMSDE